MPGSRYRSGCLLGRCLSAYVGSAAEVLRKVWVMKACCRRSVGGCAAETDCSRAPSRDAGKGAVEVVRLLLAAIHDASQPGSQQVRGTCRDRSMAQIVLASPPSPRACGSEFAPRGCKPPLPSSLSPTCVNRPRIPTRAACSLECTPHCEGA